MFEGVKAALCIFTHSCGFSGAWLAPPAEVPTRLEAAWCSGSIPDSGLQGMRFPFPLCKATGEATSSIKKAPNLWVEMLIRASYAY